MIRDKERKVVGRSSPVPVVPGVQHPDGPQCDACKIRGGVNKATTPEGLTLCVDFRACCDRVRNDELAIMAMGGAV